MKFRKAPNVGAGASGIWEHREETQRPLHETMRLAEAWLMRHAPGGSMPSQTLKNTVKYRVEKMRPKWPFWKHRAPTMRLVEAQCAYRKHCYPETPLGSHPTFGVSQKFPGKLETRNFLHTNQDPGGCLTPPLLNPGLVALSAVSALQQSGVERVYSLLEIPTDSYHFPSHLTHTSDPNSHFARKAPSATPGSATAGVGTRQRPRIPHAVTRSEIKLFPCWRPLGASGLCCSAALPACKRLPSHQRGLPAPF